MSGWLETYRGTVSRWEVDHNDHLTVAYYFARIADAGLGALEAIGLGADYAAHERRACVTVDCYARYSRELRVGDILHIESGVGGVEPAALVLGHKLFNSETGEVCTTVEQQVGHVELVVDGRAAASRRGAARPVGRAGARAAPSTARAQGLPRLRA